MRLLKNARPITLERTNMKPTFVIIIRFKRDAANFSKGRMKRRHVERNKKRKGERFYKMAIISLHSASGSLTGNNDGFKHRK